MEKIIACCGLNCATCDARIATVTNNNDLREKTAEIWRKQYNATGLTAEMINCTGCREEGAKLGHCNECGVRNCVITKGFQTCADCSELEKCELLAPIHKFVPDALLNLKSLN
jgi:hypothetical protein